MENDITKNIKPIDIKDYSVTFYGGAGGFQNKCHVIITLYNMSVKVAGWIKFFKDDVPVENDIIDETGVIHMNLPHSSYSDVLNTLKSRRPLQIMLAGKTAMLFESGIPAQEIKGINLN
jgi:hypothetical protein